MNNIKRKHLFLIAGIIFIKSFSVNASNKVNYRIPSQYIQHEASKNAFTIVANGKATSIYVDAADWKGVIRAANNLGNDIRKVSGIASKVKESTTPETHSIIIGTIGKSKLIDKLIADRKINVSDIKGQWESFVIQTVDGNLIVAGADKRGTIYGIYDISEKIGVSPWYFWADVPAKKSNKLYVKAGRFVQDSPKVKYRGIFINDESPSFTGWCNAKFGGVNSKMYVNMFELLLRLKANFLWPAMWGNAFNEDDPMNPVLADEYGIVMGNSHHEPMMRAQKEYTKRKQKIGEWDFVTNSANLEKFWFEGLNRNKNYDNVITMGMRGDGDVAMGKGEDLENIKTLQNVVKSQRDIIRKVYNDDPANHPQLWAIFTEVQRYYDAGLTVPDDIILLFCDNNWGYIRRTLPLKEKDRIGGGGLYYHIDMNGGPWNDRWVNTTTIPKLREQFNLAYQSGINKLWVVNVGDLKPKEIPIDFIMHYAWNPEAVPADKTMDYSIDWATKTFGSEHAVEIADIVSKYPKYNLWRKAEAQVPNIFSIVNHNEGDRVIQLWRDVANKAEALKSKIAPEAQDAYYQLVLYPTKASAGVAEMYIAADKNNLYAKQGRVSANDYAKRVRDLYDLDKQLSDYYNGPMADGKWKNMMSDIHICYRIWSMPLTSTMPAVVDVTPLPTPAMGIAVEGSEQAWPASAEKAALPVFDGLNKKPYYIDVFNRGTGAFTFNAVANNSWIKLSVTKGTVEKENRIIVDIDWESLPVGKADGLIEIRQGDSLVQVQVSAVKSIIPVTTEPYFGSLTGEFSIPANKFNANVAGKKSKWLLLPDLGRDEACMGIFPVTAPSEIPKTAPRLEYKMYLNQQGKTTFCIGILPTQDVNPERGLRIAVSIDNGEPQILDARKGLVDTFTEYTPTNLANSKVLKPLPPLNKEIALVGTGKLRRNEIFDNIRWLDVQLDVAAPGFHTLKVFMIDPELVLERIVVNPDNDHLSYFGVPSLQHNAK
ncbi:glycosyl hydrolase 115 family protein [Bacteroides ihuae]|uniref:glycosyl hydrolase 115 family protein n=1 Tax=Bacteroides ihuae TaxID=1852362 RepID=UPI0008DA541A|nr:glycosyl hydrolase 115 family protein [Bacteroides ihuae]